MSSPTVAPEALEAVQQLVRRAMEEPTKAIMERLDRVEEQLAASATPHPEDSTSTQGMLGIPRVGGRVCSISQGRAPCGVAELETTPSGGGAVPTGSSIPGLSSFNAELGTAGGIASGSYALSPPAGLATPAPLLGGSLSNAGPSGLGSLGETPLGSVVPIVGAPSFVGGVVVGQSSPPVPAKLAEKIWKGEFVDLSALLPHRLGAPEPTLAEALQRKSREDKQITYIEQWVVCFCSYTSVVAIRAPHRVRDLLAYTAMIVKAAHDYHGCRMMPISAV